MVVKRKMERRIIPASDQDDPCEGPITEAFDHRFIFVPSAPGNAEPMENMAIFANFDFKTFLSRGLALGKTEDDGMHPGTPPNKRGAPWMALGLLKKVVNEWNTTRSRWKTTTEYIVAIKDNTEGEHKTDNRQESTSLRDGP